MSSLKGPDASRRDPDAHGGAGQGDEPDAFGLSVVVEGSVTDSDCSSLILSSTVGERMLKDRPPDSR